MPGALGTGSVPAADPARSPGRPAGGAVPGRRPLFLTNAAEAAPIRRPLTAPTHPAVLGPARVRLDRQPSADGSAVWALRPGRQSPRVVSGSRAANRQVAALRVARDGVRVALVLKGPRRRPRVVRRPDQRRRHPGPGWPATRGVDPRGRRRRRVGRRRPDGGHRPGAQRGAPTAPRRPGRQVDRAAGSLSGRCRVWRPRPGGRCWRPREDGSLWVDTAAGWAERRRRQRPGLPGLSPPQRPRGPQSRAPAAGRLRGWSRRFRCVSTTSAAVRSARSWRPCSTWSSPASAPAAAAPRQLLVPRVPPSRSPARRPARAPACPAGSRRPGRSRPTTGAVREALLAHKERRPARAGGPLGAALAEAVARRSARRERADRPRAGSGPVAPGRDARPRARPDAADRAARGAVLRAAAWPRAWCRCCAVARGLGPGGLGAAARADNLAGAHRVRARRAARLGGAGAVVLVDDLVTTGASLAEAARALRTAGGSAGRGGGRRDAAAEPARPVRGATG